MRELERERERERERDRNRDRDRDRERQSKREREREREKLHRLCIAYTLFTAIYYVCVCVYVYNIMFTFSRFSYKCLDTHIACHSPYLLAYTVYVNNQLSFFAQKLL